MSRVWHVVLLGPPLSGKSVQARVISKTLSIPTISTGEIFRQAIVRESELGLKIREIVDSGRLVPDEIVISVVEDHLNDPVYKNGYLLDGFPRTPAQAEFIEGYLNLQKSRLDRLIVLKIPEEEIIRRAASRRQRERRRDDESDQSLMNRLRAYKNETLGAIQFFENRNRVSHIDGLLTIPQVSENIRKILELQSNE